MICVQQTLATRVSFTGGIWVSPYWLTTVFGPAPKNHTLITGRLQAAHFESVSIGAMFELVTERLDFLSQLPEVPHVITEDFIHLKVKCCGRVWCKRLFVPEYLPSFRIGVCLKTSCGLSWQMWMLLCCWLVWWVKSAYYVNGRQVLMGFTSEHRDFMLTTHQVKYPFSGQAWWLL